MDGYTRDDILKWQKEYNEKYGNESKEEFAERIMRESAAEDKRKSDAEIARYIADTPKYMSNDGNPYAMKGDSRLWYNSTGENVIKPKDEYAMEMVEVFKKPSDKNNDEYNRDLAKYNWQQQWVRAHEDINSAIRQGMNPKFGRSKKWVYDNVYKPYKKDFWVFQNSDEYKNAIEKDMIKHAQLKEEEDRRLKNVFESLTKPTKKSAKKRPIDEVEKIEEPNDKKIKPISSSDTKTKDSKELRKDNLRSRMNKKRQAIKEEAKEKRQAEEKEAKEKLQKQKEDAQKLPKPTQEDLAHAIEGLPEGWGANISNSWNRIYYFKTDGTNNQQWTRPTNSGGKKKGKSVKKKSSKKGKGTRKK
tara:strand:- start:800 stop:1876 length:1077 start_codon:yes stop_codon:yes gene_type:complete